MSLINDMLQDLEKRRAPLPERAAVPRHVRVLPAARSSRHLPLFTLVVIGSLPIAAAAWYLYGRTSSVPHTPAVVSAAPEAHPQPVAKPADVVTAPQPRIAADAQSGPIPTASVIAAPREATDSAPMAGLTVELSAARLVHVERDPIEAAPREEPSVAVIEPRNATKAPAAQRKPTLPVNVSLRMDALSVAGAAPSVEKTAPSTHPQIDRKVRELSSVQIAENDYRAGANLLNQGRIAEAQERFGQALRQAPSHVGARQALFGLLVQAKRTGEAEQLLAEALHLDPAQPGFAMAVARLQVDRGDSAAALTTLQTSVHAARAMPDYLAFLAALLQRQGRHAQSADMYEAALAIAPRSGVWLMGLGISLQALNRNNEAQDAFRRAKASDSLSGDLQAFVDQRLRQLQ